MLKDVEVRETSPAITGPRRSTSRYKKNVPKLAKSGSLEINDIANTMYTFQVSTFQVPSSVCAQASLLQPALWNKGCGNDSELSRLL